MNSLYINFSYSDFCMFSLDDDDCTKFKLGMSFVSEFFSFFIFSDIYKILNYLF